MYLGLATNAELIGRMTLVLLQPLRYVDPPPLLSLPLLPVVAMWLFWSSNARRMWKWPFINIQGARNLGLPVFLAAAALGLDPALSERLVLLLARTLSYWVRGGRAARRRGFLGNVFMVIQSGTEITDMRLAETLASLQRVDRGGGWGWLLVSLLVPVLAAIQALVVRLWRWSVVQLERVEFEELVEEMRAARDHGTGGVVMPTRR
ncbi:hypothetical protein Vretifemale_6172 [Volvox reticuliferus]|nr:hypothetical protein Vretifemale_6172 [Volvox reticuliferus]